MRVLPGAVMNRYLYARRGRQRGMSLVEIMVSVVIGLVVVGAVLVSYIGSGKTGRYQAAYAQMNEDAQVALNILSRDIQLAGYVNPVSVVVATSGLGGAYSDQPVAGCDTGFTSANPIVPGTPISGGGLAGARVYTCNASGKPELEIGYEADAINTPPSGVFPTDCAGYSLQYIGMPALAPTYYAVRNRYYIATTASSKLPELHCKSNALDVGGSYNSGQPIVENVDAMRIWFGVTADESALPAPKPRQIVRYVSAADVGGNWDRVVAVRVCLVLRSTDKVISSEEPVKYKDCTQTLQSIADGYLRRAYYTTATIRSRMAL